tara:strand:+ start:286 stop:2223 length:1938 start_codon:yes stop_codon:yes gene_type:complete
MAERVRLNRSILSSNYRPSATTEVGLLEQEAVGQSQITQLLNTMSGFFYDQMAEKVVEEGELLGARNPITIDEIKKAQQTGENVVGRLGYGMKGKAARSTAFKILQNEIEVEARREFQNVTNEAIKQNIPYEELADSLDAITIGYTDLLSSVDPKMAYNVKGNLSVISNSLYTKYADDQIKKQQANDTLREMFAMQDDIQTIKPTLKQFIKGGDPKAILSWTKEYRQTFEEVILNSNLSDANKAKFRNESQDIIDDVIVETLVEYSLDNNVSLSRLIEKEIKNKGQLSKGNIIYNIKNSDISSLVNSLSRESINNLVPKLNTKLEEMNDQKKIDLDQGIAEAQIKQDVINQRLKSYFETYNLSDGPIETNIQADIEELKFLNQPLYNKYAKAFKGSRAGFATRPNIELELMIEQQIKEDPFNFEITDLLAEQENLTQEFFESMKKEVVANQQEEYKEFLKEVSINSALAREFPELNSQINESNVAFFSAAKQKDEYARKTIMQNFLKLEATKSVRKGRAFNPVEALRKFKIDNADLLADPRGRKAAAAKIGTEHFTNFIDKYKEGLKNTGLFRDLQYPDDIVDTEEFYKTIAKNYFENKNVQAAVANFFRTSSSIEKVKDRGSLNNGFVIDLRARAKALGLEFEE